ncbi:hypothetical protein WT15_23745 [Burkholderia stagnalis]|uniref:hypothetical protein n=1 Tax=Burkholderia stagnalis TaxID=1503054 RepID=UPI00075C692A|nr:hypothetical protein [Burkholderia stagnalis]KVN73860.1 hypothetical protein WT15_23745 [Burkholderia stagnalis]KWO27032.1 hypothetical protein WT96_31135 [Burkholderia stagnalis]KWO45030.1 hypothetical protein WT95_26780 [Burkholderia stagnalis]
MSKYEKLDALILEAIGDTPKKFAAINVGPVRTESERIAREEVTPRTRGDVVAWRMVDSRLQALRKAGKIRSTSTGWVRA